MIELIDSDNKLHGHTYRLTALTERDLVRDMVLAWQVIINHIQEDRKDGTWNRLFFECWIDNAGYVLVYPQKRGDSPDYRVPLIKLLLDYLLSKQVTFDNAATDEDLKNAIDLAYIEVSSAIRNSYNKEPALSKLKELLAANDFTAWTLPEHDRELMMEFGIFFKQ